MKDTLQPGIEYELRFRIPASKTVPVLYPEAPEFQAMPEVFASGYMVGLLEWACIRAVNPHLAWPEEQTVGTYINVSHIAATPPGLEVTASVKLLEVNDKRLLFAVEAHDGIELISRGTHERYVINKSRFTQKALAKADRENKPVSNSN